MLDKLPLSLIIALLIFFNCSPQQPSNKPKSGAWAGDGITFVVSNDGSKIVSLQVTFPITSGGIRIGRQTRGTSNLAILDSKFAEGGGGYSLEGVFRSQENCSGSVWISEYDFNIGHIINGHLDWIATPVSGTGPNNSTDADAVALDRSALTITYASGDNAGSVTQNISLPVSGANGSSISWVTSTSSRITTEGVVTRPAAGSGDASVTLTATIAKGTASDVKVFSLTVKAIGGVVIGTGTVTDIDGNVYKTVKIGNQEWMAENLRVTKYNDGSAITHVTDSAAWRRIYDSSLTTPAYCFYKNTTNADSIKKYGALYNWYALNTGNLAPSGWHVPTDAEWKTLENYLVLNGYNWDGTTDTSEYNKIAKALAAKTDWYSSTTSGAIGNDLSKNNSSGFSALPGGYRYYDGTFYAQRYNGDWWSATELDASHAWNRYLGCDSDYLYRFSNYKSCGFSVRLLRD